MKVTDGPCHIYSQRSLKNPSVVLSDIALRQGRDVSPHSVNPDTIM